MCNARNKKATAADGRKYFTGRQMKDEGWMMDGLYMWRAVGTK